MRGIFIPRGHGGLRVLASRAIGSPGSFVIKGTVCRGDASTLLASELTTLFTFGGLRQMALGCVGLCELSCFFP